ncbi:formin-like protein 3 [Geospiza fortis]|uniref:Formin-like protein 3 n=1 Tax=Geospiza fortis TaxID=48883 RepID=A0A8N5EYS9_GEOFO|nr:formin-like protein 3 [Geospiza fortis]
MNLPPDKARLLRQYDNEKKWDLICDQERFQVKSPPHAYIQKLRSFLEPGVTRKKFRRRVQESTKVLRELEISLRTNHIGSPVPHAIAVCPPCSACAPSRLDFEGLEGAEDGALEKLRSWSRSIEDLQHPSALPAPFSSSLARSARQTALRYGTLPSRRALKNSRLVSQKDDVHLCIMCLRAIMNYQYGFNLVMSHPHAVNEIALSLNNKNPRMKALVLELLAAVCLVRGGHEIILAAFDNFKEVCKEKHRFERLMEYFRNEDSSIDFMVACMQFINIVVHSVEDMNFRVHLQYEFTKLGLEEFLQKSRHTESEKLQVQIQAYLDNVFDVGGLLEDAETKNVALEKVEELEDHLSHLTEKLLDLENENMMRVAELEKQLLQREKELEVVKETYEHRSHQVHTLRRMIKEKGKCPPAPPLPGASPSIALTVGLSAIRIKKPIKTKFRLPVFNWTALKPSQISGTVFSELDDERVLEWGAMWKIVYLKGIVKVKKPIQTKFRMPVFNWVALKPSQIDGTVFTELNDEKVLQELDMSDFEEQFKTKAQGPALDISALKAKATQKAPSKVTLMESNRAKNLAITLRKAGRSAAENCRAIHTFDLATLPVDFVECLMRFLPTEAEAKALRQYEPEPPCAVPLQQLNAIIAASASVKSSQKLKHMLEIILALGNYMNSSKRGAVYGFKLQSLDLLLDTKSTDRKMTLLHFIALTVREKYPELATFWQELHFVEKAAAVSLENVLLDVKELGRGMELLRRECGQHESAVLRGFLGGSEGQLERLQRDARTAEDAYNTVVRYFGESPKTTPPSVFFPVFVRFIHSYKDAEQENETRKKQEEVMREKLLAQEAKKQEKRNKWQQQELIAELRRRQAKDHRPMYEGKDGTIEDIITGTAPSAPSPLPWPCQPRGLTCPTARTAKRGSRFFCDPSHHDESSC